VVKKTFQWFLVALFLFALLTSVYSALITSTDLQDHWVNTKALLSGANIYDETVYNQVSSMATSQYGLPPYDVYPIYPPSCYAMLTPFAMMDWTAAKASWLILSLILTFLLVKELSDSFCSGKYFVYLLAALVCSIPWRQHILYGQNAIWSLYFFVLAARLSGQNKTVLSGISLALAMFKYSLIGPMCLFFLVYKKVWKNLLIALGLHGLVNLFFSLYLHQSFIYLLLAPLKWCGHKSGGGAYDFFGLWSLLIGPPSRITYLFSAFAILALVLMMVKKRGSDDTGFLALAAMVSTIIIYHSVNDYIVVLFPVAWILTRQRWDRGLVLMAFGVFLIGYLRGHYFHFDWQPSHAFIARDAGAASVAPVRLSFKTLYTASYSFFWFLSVGILGFKLACSPDDSMQKVSPARSS
jgi:hypothetical protein